ncbi:MAG: lipoprotein signal peptidase [Candidatus Mesenet longicola]|uniref:Lipoprotein signal peptidase n=1 Tax=Candidatus Mesenet longicola TaxID=1892558 RepID=A0A8J3HSG0_9RICK|nr:MAG: lipoprotein signal peptidase [Candidatus Mesenet longicola]GHM59423.1 MAG: lipoprotein signal peptidase [Candidatus Mesenet longicola]
MRMFYPLIISIIVLIDQISKLLIRLLIASKGTIKICSFLKFIEIWNSGISFGLFDDLPRNNIIFSLSSIIITCIFTYVLYKTRSKLVRFNFSLIIGGAMGNLIDRVYWGAVYDFIDIKIINWHWPTFNLADSFIVIGMLLLIFKWYVYDLIKKA